MSISPETTTSDAASPVTAGFALSRPQRHRLSSLGHQVARFAAACDQLRARKDSFSALAPWFRSDSVRESCALEGNGVFACPVSLDGGRMSLDPLALSAEECATALARLPGEAAGRAEAIAISSSLNAPLWLALLRLRPLREFWERALRRATVDTLLAWLPDAWLLDPTPIPPGGVIPRLEIAAWSALDLASRRFNFSTAEDVAQALSAFPQAAAVLKAAPRVPVDAVSLVSFYRLQDGRVTWLGLLR